jgi:hypothetical protein
MTPKMTFIRPEATFRPRSDYVAPSEDGHANCYNVQLEMSLGGR